MTNLIRLIHGWVNMNYNKNKYIGISIVFITILITGLLCLKHNKPISDSNKFKIVTTFYPIYVQTLNITENIEDVEVENLTNSAVGCLHDYQLLPEDMIKLENADVLIANGEGMENFLDDVKSVYPNLKVIYINEDIGLLEEKGHHCHECEEEHHHEEENEAEEHEEHSNSHVWLSVSRNIKQVENMEGELSKINPQNAEKYNENAHKYIKKLENLKFDMENELKDLKNKEIVTDNETFAYLIHDLNLENHLIIEEKIGTEANMKDISEAIEEIKVSDVKAIFKDSQEKEKSYAEIIANESNVPIYTLNSIVTGENNKDEYIRLMRQNIKVLKEALK